MYKKYLILFFMLLFFLKPVFADTYPAISNAKADCSSGLADLQAQNYYLSSSRTYSISNVSNTGCDISYNHDFAWRINFTAIESCPTGTLSNGSCLDAPACPIGTTRNVDGTCPAPLVSCKATEYHDTPTTCKVQPTNCTNITGTGFFDVVAGTCSTASVLPTYGCEPGDSYCPTIKDCIRPGQPCGNDPSFVSATTAKQVVDLATAKATSAQDLTSAATAADQASNAAAAAASTAASLKAAISTAGDALNDPSLTDAQKIAAQVNFQHAIEAYAKAAALAGNAAVAATAAQGDVVSAQGASDTINNPNSSPSAVRAAAGISSGSVADAGSNLGAATTGTSLAPTNDTKGLASDANLSSVGDKVSALGDKVKAVDDDLKKLGDSTPSGKYDDLPDSFYESKYPGGLNKIWDTKKQSFEQTSFKQALRTLMPTFSNSGECPSWTFPSILGFELGTLSMPCYVWPIIRVFMMITTLFYVRKLVFGG